MNIRKFKEIPNISSAPDVPSSIKKKIIQLVLKICCKETVSIFKSITDSVTKKNFLTSIYFMFFIRIYVRMLGHSYYKCLEFFSLKVKIRGKRSRRMKRLRWLRQMVKCYRCFFSSRSVSAVWRCSFHLVRFSIEATRRGKSSLCNDRWIKSRPTARGFEQWEDVADAARRFPRSQSSCHLLHFSPRQGQLSRKPSFLLCSSDTSLLSISPIDETSFRDEKIDPLLLVCI